MCPDCMLRLSICGGCGGGSASKSPFNCGYLMSRVDRHEEAGVDVVLARRGQDECSDCLKVSWSFNMHAVIPGQKGNIFTRLARKVVHPEEPCQLSNHIDGEGTHTPFDIFPH